MIAIFYFIEFFFIIILFVYKLYSLVDKTTMSSNIGNKLNKYITKQSVQQYTTCNLVSHKLNIRSISSFFNNLSPSWWRQGFYTLLITALCITIRIAISYRYLFSHFIYISVFGKSIDLVSFLGPYFFYVRNMYYIIYLVTIFNIVYYVVHFYFKKQLENSNTNRISNESTVFLAKEESGKDIILTEKGMFQNIAITGSIGSGKTSSAISWILAGLLQKKIGGLVIDMKGSYLETVEKMASYYHRKVIAITLENKIPYNPLLLENMSAMEVAHMLKQVLLLLSDENTSDSFWLDKVESYLRDFIILILAYQSYLTFSEIHQLITNESYLRLKMESVRLKALENVFPDETLYEIQSALQNIKQEYFTLDERTIGIIKAEITRITSVFISDYQIYQQFCQKSEPIHFLQGDIVVVSIPMGKYRLLSKVISTYMKLDFQRQVLSQKPPYHTTFFIGDEYMEMVNIEDASFFSVSREYCCINVIAMQSYTSLKNALKKESACQVILQNFVNKIWFRNDDVYTVSEIIKQLGKEEKDNIVRNYTETGQNTRYHRWTKHFKDYKTGISKSYSYTPKLEYKFHEAYFTTKLKTFEAALMLSDGNQMQFYQKAYFQRWEETDENKM